MAKKRTGVTFCGVLWCDDPTHEAAIRRIIKYYDYFIVKHKGEQDDDFAFEQLVQIDKDGNEIVRQEADDINTKNKDHWHVVFIFPYNFKKSAICKKLGITENYIEVCSNRDSYLRYMTHFGDRSKIQYSRQDFMTNREIILNKALLGMYSQDEQRLMAVDEIIQNKNCDNYPEYFRSMLKEGHGDFLRQYSKQSENIYQAVTGRPLYTWGSRCYADSNDGLL